MKQWSSVKGKPNLARVPVFMYIIIMYDTFVGKGLHNGNYFYW